MTLKIIKNKIFQGGMIFFAGGIAANTFNYLYRVAMARMLGPEFFGELVAMISLIFILVIPSAPIQIAATRFSAVFEAESAQKRIKSFFNYLTIISGFTVGAIVFFGIIFANQIQTFLKLSSVNYIYFVLAIITAMFASGITKGILKGLKRFSLLSLATFLESLFKFLIGVILVFWGFKMFGALAGLLIPAALVYLLSFYFLKDVLLKKEGRPQKEKVGGLWRYICYSFLTVFLLNVLINIDKILVKLYFSDFEAGIYSSFASLGQATFIGVSLLAGILFPLVAFNHAQKKDYYHYLKKISLVSLVVISFVVLVFFLFSDPLFMLFFGKEYILGASFLGYYAGLMGLLGLVFLFSYFLMALSRFKFLYLLAAGAVLEVLLITFFHNSFFQVILVFFLSLAFTSLGLLFYILFSNIYEKRTRYNLRHS